MFYDQFLKVCKEKGVKPTPALKEIGLSPGNLKKWESGSSVGSDTLEKLAAYFGVPVDYFFQSDDSYTNVDITDNANAISKVYYIMKSNPEIICSILNGSTLNSADLYRIANYMGCKVAYLNPDIDESTLAGEPDAAQAANYLTENEQLLDILGRAAANKAYRCLQVQISRIVVSNLEKLGVTLKDTLELNLAEKKTRDLFDRAKEPTEIAPFNCSDIFRIANGFKVSLTYLFTGRD
ncbi:MAG: helix-turn-helix transcriptional regulator [Eubacterium sp.]|nr:helix-turn-helix transcriptional regulator [Eubacterium sp.]